MKDNHKETPLVGNKARVTSLHAVAEDILSQKLADIVTILGDTTAAKSRVYEDVTAIVERCLFRIALERSQHVKSRAADYLGINRNTFHKKMTKLGLER
ncbi:MAG TPA: helix-turn-helix domain-containing protein [Syntrophales bacterium]|jgi:Fis family transcriptional regulator|nr:helix-turn-helix domain-containing protein [Syntrophales bacterium]HOD97409.1 helix-turn-helix domain-containing protein [Syntrophales bacterium]HOH72217.1 helix-turn-helix domain-containing protein [Syntrophales bacterium]HPN08328.1 helix-turn-helix domain-containing protein [Syntrophales bacterium]HPX82608.1 helix-turn-helix domain-containing protein [Syntrophales bacterium]